MALSPGTLLNNRYRIVSILGHGGMGSVYRADDENLDIPVAVKENLFLSDEYSRQFQREARILASLRHPNLPRVGDYYAIEGQGQYLIMDYIEGEDLRQRIERLNNLPERDVILIGIAICDALTYLHSRQPSVVHRDIKPGNIKITPSGEIFLVDFGLAKLMLSDQATTTGARAMTPGYSPPEQYGTARTDSRTDIYSLGATLYAALTGVIPEDGLARATGKAELTPVRQLQPKIRKQIAAVIEKSLEIEPDDRYQTATEFRKQLIIAGELSHVHWQKIQVTPPPLTEEALAPVAEQDATPVEESRPERTPPPGIPARKPAAPVANRLWYVILILGLLGGSLLTGNAFLKARAATSPTAQQGPTGTSSAATSIVPLFAPQVTTTRTLMATPRSILIPTSTSLAAAGTAQPNPIGGGSGEIAFASDRTGTFQIWVTNPDGSGLRQVTDLPGGACQPSWSPDGLLLAAISPCETKSLFYPESKIYIVNPDGSNPHPLPLSRGGDFDPAWSPDGRRIAFTSMRTGKPHIFVFNLDSLTLEELSDTRYPDMHPAWSPTGKQLAFIREMSFNHIFVMSDKGETQFQFSSSGNVNDLWPNWSSDGKFILYSRSQVEPSIPWLLMLNYEDRGTGKESRIPTLDGAGKDPGPIAEPSLSPDNRWVAYESWPDGNNHDIYLIRIDGKERIRLTTDPGFDFDPAWRPFSVTRQ